MEALRLLLTTDFGLMSLGAIVITIAIGAYFARWFIKQSRDSGSGPNP